MARIYAVRVAIMGADSPRTFYFERKKNAKACYDAYDMADDIYWFEDDGSFPEDMFSDACFEE